MGLPDNKPPHRYDFHPAILQTNRKIHSEAADIFYRQNAVVAVTCTILERKMDVRDLVTVARGHYADDFKHHSLEVHLGPRGPQMIGDYQVPPQRVIVAGDDVSDLCCFLPQICYNHYTLKNGFEWVSGRVDVELNVGSNAVAKDEKAGYDSDPPSVKWLLEPFRQLYGYHVVVEGRVTTSYKESIEASCAVPPPTDLDVLCIVLKGRDEGDEALQKGSPRMALSRYKATLDVMTSAYKRLASRNSMVYDLDIHDENDIKAMDILQLSLRSLLADAFLKEGQYAKAYRCAQDFDSWYYLFGEDNISIKPEFVRLMFCKALAGKALGEPVQALKDIDEALSVSPDDEAMKEERKVLCGLVRKKLQNDVRMTWAGGLNVRTGKLKERNKRKVKRLLKARPCAEGYSLRERKDLESLMDRKDFA